MEIVPYCNQPFQVGKVKKEHHTVQCTVYSVHRVQCTLYKFILVILLDDLKKIQTHLKTKPSKEVEN